MVEWLGSNGSMTLAVKRDGTARIVARRDDYGIMPEGDCFVPQIMIPHGWQRDDIMINDHMIGVDVRDIVEALETFRVLHGHDDGVEVFKRWARVFHDVNAELYLTRGYCQGDWAEILAWPSAEWRDMVGVADDYAPDRSDVSELSAWLWGDVYHLRVEQLADVDVTQLADMIEFGGLYAEGGNPAGLLWAARENIVEEEWQLLTDPYGSSIEFGPEWDPDDVPTFESCPRCGELID